MDLDHAFGLSAAWWGVIGAAAALVILAMVFLIRKTQARIEAKLDELIRATADVNPPQQAATDTLAKAREAARARASKRPITAKVKRT
ncbi:MAG: low affinity iron permease family protein [Caulobacteraceae bacterium]